VKALGNEREGGTGDSEFWSAFAIPLGYKCNNYWPRCPFQSTPTDGAGNFHPLGNLKGSTTPYPPPVKCAPWANWQGSGTSMRPAKGGTAFTPTMNSKPIPPLYRNPHFFTASTPSAQPNGTYCTGSSTSLGGLPGTYTMMASTAPGRVAKGIPVAGTWNATTSSLGGFSFPPAPVNHQAGIRTGQGTRETKSHSTMGVYTTQGSARSGLVGDFPNVYPYLYSYTYATLRNDAGVFGPGKGPGNATLYYGNGDATITIKQGAARFGGTMRMLGALTTKSCYYRQGGCSLGYKNWRYDAVGAKAYTTGGPTMALKSGHEVSWPPCNYYCPETPCYYTHITPTSRLRMEGERFPWTTGSVTVKATGRGEHKTVYYAHGYDNRTPTSHKGTIQLVSPVLTRWLQPCCNNETGGIGILRIKFVPEPRAWVTLIAGVSCLGVLYRWRH
jgi:hypothetical protein